MISLLIRDMWSVHSPVYRQVVSLRATNAAVSASRSFDFPKGQTDFAAPVGREACLDMPGIVQKNAVLPSPVSRRIARTARASVGASAAFRQSSKLQEKFRIRHKPFGCDEQKAHRELSRLAPTARLNSAGDWTISPGQPKQEHTSLYRANALTNHHGGTKRGISDTITINSRVVPAWPNENAQSSTDRT